MNEILDNEKPHKEPIFKIKHVLIVFISGWILIFLGSLFKIESWEFASELIILGTATIVLSLALAIVKLILIKDLNSIFNK